MDFMKGRGMGRLSIIIILLVVSIGIVAVGCGGGDEPPPAATATPVVSTGGAYLSHTDVITGFSIDYPDNWEQIPEELIEGYTGEMGITGFWAPVACAEIITNFNIVTEELPFLMSVGTYFDASQRHIRSFEGYTPVSDEEIAVNEIEAIKHIYDVTQDIDTIRQMQVYMVEGTLGWVITFSCAADCWQQYEDVFDRITASFKLLR